MSDLSDWVDLRKKRFQAIFDKKSERRDACNRAERNESLEYCRYYNGEYCNHICKYAMAQDVRT